MLRFTHATARRLVALAGAAALTVAGAALQAPAAVADTAPPAGTTPTVSADALPTVQINGVAWSQVIVGNKVFVAGQFTSVRPAGSPAGTNETPRSNLLAYDLTTGALITSWAPTLNGVGQEIAASPDGSRVYVTGTFTSVSGVTRNRLVALDTTTGAVVSSFAPSFNARTRSIAVGSDGTVYVGGIFTTVNSQPRTRLAAISAAGILLPWAPSADAEVLALTAPAGSGKVYAGGKFAAVNGDTSAYGLAMLDGASGALLPFPANNTVRNAGAEAAIYSLSTDNTSIFGTGYTFGGGGNFESTFAANAATGALNWVSGCRGDTYDAAPGGGVLYWVGHIHDCAEIGGNTQTDPWTYQYAYAASTGADTHGGVNQGGNFGGQPAPELLHWLPTLTVGTYTGQTQAAWDVAANSQYVVLGGEFPKVNGTAQQGLVRFAVRSIAPNTQGPQGGNDMNPTLVSLAPGTVRVSWKSAWDRDNRTITYTVLKGASPGSAVAIGTVKVDSTWWARPPAAFTDTSVAPGTTQTYRIRATDPLGNVVNGNPTSITVPAGTAGPSPYGDAVRADSPTTYWPLGEASGTAAYDWIGADDLTLDASATRGTPGAITSQSAATATTFAGTAAVPGTDATLRTGPDTYTAEAWIKTTTTSGGKILGFGNSNTGNSSGYDRHIYMTNDGRVVFGVYDNGTRMLTSAQAYNDGNWHQIVTSLGSAGMTLYVDGKKIGSRADTVKGQPYSGYWRVGGDNLNGWDNQPASSSFAGAIDDVSIYPTALPLAKVQAHYTASGRTLVTPQKPADAYGAAVYDDQPDVYWRHDTTSGAGAFDTMAAEADGTYSSGITLGQAGSPAAPTGKSIALPGGAQTVVANQPTSNPTVFSEETWFKTTTTTGGRIIGFGNASAGNTSSNYDRHVYMFDDGRLRYGVWDGNTEVIDTSASYNDGQWHHVVATFGPAGMGLYLDGALVGTHSPVTPQAYDGYWRIGSDNTWGGASTNDFSGAIDETAIYPTVLSAANVAQHWQLGGGTGPTPNQPPAASFTSSASDLTASFDGSGSTDADGTIASWAWDFGDGATGTGATTTHPYAAAGTFQVKLTVTDDDGDTGTVTEPLTVTAAPADPTAARDTFGRTVASGFGTADVGGAWTVVTGGSAVSVADGAGRVSIPVGRTTTAKLGAVSTRDVDLVDTVWAETAPTGGGVYLSSSVRSTSAGEYRSRVRLQSDGKVLFNLSKVVGATETAISTQIVVSGITYTAGMKLMVRTQAVGSSPTTLRAKVWVAGTTEPAAWLQSVTDSTAEVQGAGGVGLVDFVSGSATAALVVRHDDVVATKL
jgi:PKD repeat protein